MKCTIGAQASERTGTVKGERLKACVVNLSVCFKQPFFTSVNNHMEIKNPCLRANLDIVQAIAPKHLSAAVHKVIQVMMQIVPTDIKKQMLSR